MKKLIPFHSIIVHPGSSHFDERMATALALANLGHSVPVFRREPTKEEVEDCNVLVLDIGGAVSDWSNTFDHHQFTREHAPECAFSLVAEAIGVKPELEAFYSWFKSWRTIDSKGPFQWAKEHGVDWDAVSSLLNPDMDTLARWWEKASGDTPVHPILVDLLREQGEIILAGAEKFKTICEMVKNDCLALTAYGIPVYDLRKLDPNDALEVGNKIAAADGVPGGVLVSRDNRGPGDCYYRRNDDIRVDFSKCQGKAYCAFAHNGGFILKTTEPGTDIGDVIRDAKTAE